MEGTKAKRLRNLQNSRSLSNVLPKRMASNTTIIFGEYPSSIFLAEKTLLPLVNKTVTEYHRQLAKTYFHSETRANGSVLLRLQYYPVPFSSQHVSSQLGYQHFLCMHSTSQ